MSESPFSNDDGHITMTMNQTSETAVSNMTSNDLLDIVHQNFLIKYKPIIIFVSITSVIGLIGNMFAVFFFTLKVRMTSTIVFIIALSSMDILVCIMAIAALTDIWLNVYFKEVIVCKAIYFFNHLTIIASVLILWVISIDRHRKICKPYCKQFNIRTAKITISILIVISLVFAIPFYFIADIVKVPFTVPGGTKVVLGNYCTNTDRDELQIVVSVFHSIDTFMIICMFITFVITYGCILWKIKVHSKQMFTITAKKRGSKKISDKIMTSNSMLNLTTSIGSFDIIPNSITNIAGIAVKNNTQPMVPIEVIHDLNVSSERTTNSPSCTPITTRKFEPNKSADNSKSERNITFIMVFVSLGFVACFLPYFFIIGFRMLTLTDESEREAWFQLLLRTPFFNSMINPVIYCVFNPQFRIYIKQKLFGCKSDTT